MARDEKARERGQPQLDRRSHLRPAGAAGAFRRPGTATAEDGIDGNVTGYVVGGTNGYRFSGDVTHLQPKGSPAVTDEDTDD